MWLQTDTVEMNQVTSAQMWVLLLGQVIFLIWLLVLNKVQVTVYATSNIHGQQCIAPCKVCLHNLFQRMGHVPF